MRAPQISRPFSPTNAKRGPNLLYPYSIIPLTCILLLYDIYIFSPVNNLQSGQLVMDRLIFKIDI